MDEPVRVLFLIIALALVFLRIEMYLLTAVLLLLAVGSMIPENYCYAREQTEKNESMGSYYYIKFSGFVICFLGILAGIIIMILRP